MIDLSHLTDVELKVLSLATSAIYADDNSEYLTALREIVSEISEPFSDILEDDPELAYNMLNGGEDG